MKPRKEPTVIKAPAKVVRFRHKGVYAVVELLSMQDLNLADDVVKPAKVELPCSMLPIGIKSGDRVYLTISASMND